MGRGQRFTEEFRVEAVRQVTERGFGVKDVSAQTARIKETDELEERISRLERQS
jgi:transposase-like protein